MKTVLKLNSVQVNRNNGTLGMTRYLQSFIDYGDFEIEYHNERVDVSRGNRGTILYYNDKKIFLDFWEYPTPTYSHKILNGNFDLIIKLQHRKMTFEHYMNFITRKNMFVGEPEEKMKTFFNKIVPFSFFPSKMFFSYEDGEKIPNIDVYQDAFFCGKGWRCRKHLRKDFESQKIDYVVSDQEIEKSISDEEYLSKMIGSKYGLVLPGRSVGVTDCKNRREIDYMILKKPLLLTYIPYYYNELIPDYHFIYYDGKTKVSDLEKKYDLSKIAQNGYEWYKNDASKEALPRVLKQIIKENLGE